MPTAALVIGAVASVAGTVMTNRAQKRAAAAKREQQELNTRRSRRQAIRQAQVARAQAVASASASGAVGSSAALGGQGAVGSQLGSGLGFSTQMSGLSGQISQASSRAQTGQAIAGLGGLGMNFGLSQGASFSNLFPQQQRQPTSPSQAQMNFGAQFGASGLQGF